MKTTQHTPGPWKWHKAYDTISSMDADCVGSMIAKIATGENEAQEDANARLIAAAPELLEACKALLEHHGSIDAPRAYRARAQAKAAIAKAEEKE